MIKSSVLITGASGFLGKYLFERYDIDDWDIVSVGRRTINSRHVHIDCDLSNQVPTLPNVPFDKVIHVAGKAHIFPKSQEEIDIFYNVNVKGTKNLLNALNVLPNKPNSIVFISTIAVYGKETGILINENAPLLSETPYGLSKIQAEELIKNWAIQNNVNYLLLRLPLIAGANPPGNLGTMKQAILKGTYIRMKGNASQKSVVVASDVADFIFNIRNKTGIYNLTDGKHPTFFQIENAIEKRLGRKIKLSIPQPVVKIMAKVGDIISAIVGKEMILTSNVLTKIKSDLTFDDSKARQEVNWTSSQALEFVEKYL
jgi:nucleoside-diphosphate-sugar epimerase